MDRDAAATPEATLAQSLVQSLAELTGLGLRMARAITEVTEAERRTVAAAAGWLPAPGAAATSCEHASRLGLGIDAADEGLAKGTPRIATLAQCFERVARAVRRTAALARRIEQGWPPPRALADGALSDDRRAMLLRQARHGAAAAIRRHADGDSDAAERLFADLDARLDDPAFARDLLERPVREMVDMLCRAIGLPPAGEVRAGKRGRELLLPDRPPGPRLGD